MKLQESGEMYLKTILRLSLQQSTVHSIDISEFMGFSKPSVSRAVSILRESGYITFHEDKSITLTETGREIATRLYERQVVLSHMLMKMGVDEDTEAEAWGRDVGIDGAAASAEEAAIHIIEDDEDE